jgi:hypothetical protein
MQNKKHQDEDSKTPYLIIDGTNSALADDSQFETTGAMKAPVDLKEYMIDDENNSSDRDDEIFDESHLKELDHAYESEEATSAKPFQGRIAKLKKIQMISASIAILAIAVFLIFIMNKNESIQKPDTSAEFAEAMIITNPPDAEVLLDGKLQGTGSPVSLKNLAAGKEHILRVQKDGFIPHERSLHLDSMQFVSLSVVLTPITPKTASLEIITSPPGATIFINDRETQKRTPLVIEDLKPTKPHSIGLYLKGYKFWSREITLHPGERRTFDLHLTKDLGSVMVDSVPEGALVIIDGVPSGQTPLEKNDLEPDRIYKVEMWHQGYEPHSGEFRATAGKTHEIRTTLKKMPTPAELEIRAREEKDGSR